MHGEGELVFEELLVALDGDIDPLRLHRLAEVGSLTYLDHRDRTPRRWCAPDATGPPTSMRCRRPT